MARTREITDAPFGVNLTILPTVRSVAEVVVTIVDDARTLVRKSLPGLLS